MASIVSICNLALSNLGKDKIDDLSEPTAAARACNQFYAHTRDLMLSGYPWRFAGKTLSLGEITNDKPGDWQYAYTRPNDCLTVRCIRPQYSVTDPLPTSPSAMGFPYEIEATTIYCDLSPAFLRYTSQIVDPSKFTPLFVDALAWHLSVRLAMPLTRDPKIRADAWQVANQMTGAAQVADANEVRSTSDIQSEFVTERG